MTEVLRGKTVSHQDKYISRVRSLGSVNVSGSLQSARTPHRGLSGTEVQVNSGLDSTSHLELSPPHPRHGPDRQSCDGLRCPVLQDVTFEGTPSVLRDSVLTGILPGHPLTYPPLRMAEDLVARPSRAEGSPRDPAVPSVSGSPTSP